MTNLKESILCWKRGRQCRIQYAYSQLLSVLKFYSVREEHLCINFCIELSPCDETKSRDSGSLQRCFDIDWRFISRTTCADCEKMLVFSPWQHMFIYIAAEKLASLNFHRFVSLAKPRYQRRYFSKRVITVVLRKYHNEPSVFKMQTMHWTFELRYDVLELKMFESFHDYGFE